MAAMSTTPTAIVTTHFSLPPLHLVLKNEARRRNFGCYIDQKEGYLKILNDIEKHEKLGVISDRILKRIIFCTNGSKSASGRGFRIWSK